MDNITSEDGKFYQEITPQALELMKANLTDTISNSVAKIQELNDIMALAQAKLNHLNSL